MQKREIFTGKSVEDAVQKAAQKIGVTVGELQYTVLDETKKGFLGLSGQATVQIEHEIAPEIGAKDFVTQVLYDMGLENAEIISSINAEGDIELSVNGDHLGAVIGRHGEVMDSLQYLTSLVVNRGKGDYIRVILDIEGYRAKRSSTLEQLAERMAERVKRTGRAVTLEPMNPYERRIIHSKVQKIEGVTTFSIGEGDERKIVVAPEGTQASDVGEAAPEKSQPRNRRVRHAKREPQKSTVDYAAIAANLPPREVREVVKAKSIDELPLADVEDTIDIVVDNKSKQ